LGEDIMRHILVIDDEQIFLDFLGQILTIMGYRVKTANSGEGAIEILRGGYDFDLVITDIVMPKIDGNAVAEYIRSSNRADIPIIAITGDSVKDNKELFNSILIKPFKVKELIAIIKSLIKNT
jgi:CheY-like chemotaxis protein